MKTEVHINPWYRVVQEDYTLPNGSAGVYYAIRGLQTAYVVAVTTGSDIVCVKQWRYLFDTETLEFPGGGVMAGETPAQAAQRELREETGYTATHWEKIGWFAPCNGLTDERCSVFLARRLTQVESLAKDSETSAVESYSVAAIEQMVKQNIITDGMTLAAWQLARTHL